MTNASTQSDEMSSVSQSVTDILNAKVASMINNVRKAEYPQARPLTTEEVMSVISGSFSSIKENASETSSAKAIDSTDPVESLTGGVVKTTLAAGMEQKKCLINPPEQIKEDKNEIQADINELARSVKP